MIDENQPLQPARVSPTDETVPDLPVLPSSPTTEIVLHQSKTSWPPTQPTFQRREIFPIGLTVLIVALAITLIVSGLGFILYAATVQYRSTLHTQATTIARLTANTHAQAQASAQSLATANANIYASATAQDGVTATASAVSDSTTATVTALNTILSQVTSGASTLNDPLSDNSGNNNWDEINGTIDAACAFKGGDYHVTEARQGYLQPCIAHATNFSNFAYQVQMIIDKGRQGGMLFRADNTNHNYYFLRIGVDGTFALDLYSGTGNPVTLSSGFSSAITTGLNQSNQLTIIANLGTLYFFANQQFITSVIDSTLTAGQIGVAAIDYRNPTEVEFSNATVWDITGFSLTPTPSASASPSSSATASPFPTATASPSPSATSSPSPAPSATASFTPNK